MYFYIIIFCCTEHEMNTAILITVLTLYVSTHWSNVILIIDGSKVWTEEELAELR